MERPALSSERGPRDDADARRICKVQEVDQHFAQTGAVDEGQSIEQKISPFQRSQPSRSARVS
jgi:hypothetical protein